MEWLKREILMGIKLLISLNLTDRPSAESLQATAEAWLIVIGGRMGKPLVEQLDAPRIRSAFQTLAGTFRRWPAPVDLIDALPARPHQQSLAAPPMSDEEQQQGLIYLAEIRKRLAAEKGLDGKVHNERARQEAIKRTKE